MDRCSAVIALWYRSYTVDPRRTPWGPHESQPLDKYINYQWSLLRPWKSIKAHCWCWECFTACVVLSSLLSHIVCSSFKLEVPLCNECFSWACKQLHFLTEGLILLALLPLVSNCSSLQIRGTQRHRSSCSTKAKCSVYLISSRGKLLIIHSMLKKNTTSSNVN